MRHFFKILLISAIFSASISFAANIPDAGRLLKESSSPQSSVPRQAPPNLPQQVNQVEQKRSNIKIKISNFSFRGNTIFSHGELSDIIAGFRDKELTLSGLEIATATVTNAYRKRGYFLASASIPPQTITPGGTLIIEVMEGILENISVETMHPNNKTDKSILEYYAHHIPTNYPLNDASLTAMIMRTNELPNITSRIMLEPGSRPGTTKATLLVTEGKPYSFLLNIDNYGNQTTGENHLSGTMNLYSPLRIGDEFNLRIQTTTTGNLLTIQTGYTMPLMSYGTKLRCNYSHVGYEMGGVFKPLKAEGSAQNLSISLSHSIVRKKNLIMNATIAGEESILNDEIASTASINQRLNRSFQAGISGITMDSKPNGNGGFTSFSLGMVKGQLHIINAETLVIDQSSDGLHINGCYTKINMALARSQPLTHRFSLQTGTYGQWSNKNLGSSEQLSLTGPGAVRAYQINESSADRAMISTIELSWRFDSTGELPGQLEFSAFMDHGYAALHTTPLPDSGKNIQNLAGAGFGIKWFDTNNYNLQSTVAWKIDGEHTAADSPLVLAQFTKNF